MTLTYRLQYAGHDILRPSASLMDVMDRWLERHAPPLYSHPGWDTRGLDHLPLPPRPKMRAPRLNVLEWPNGMSRWGCFYGLVGSAAFAAIKAAVDPLAPVAADFSIEEVDENGVATDLIRVPMYVADVRPVFCSDFAAEAGQELFLLTLVDIRYWAWWKPLEYTFAACDTWTELLTNLVTAATGQTLTISVPIDALYGEPWPLRWHRPGVPHPLLADAAAAQVGRRLVFPPTAAANVYLRDVAAALTYDATRWADDGDRCVAGGYDLSVTNLPGSIPAGWAVGFAGDNQVVETGTLAGLAIAEYGSITGVAGESVWLRADKRADESSAPLAELMATEWYKWQLSKTDATFRGILAVGTNKIPSGMEDRVEWRYLPPDTDRRTVYQPGTTPTDTPPGGLDIVRDQVLTTVVPVDRADRNLYGDRPPPGYTYAVKITARSGDAMSATIRVVDPGCPTGSGSGATAEAVTDGPALGYGTGGLVLYRDPLAARPAVGDVGTAVPDPVVPNRWIFQGAGGAATGGGECASDAWLKWISTDPRPCWTLYNQGGFGRCECWPVDDETDPAAGIILVYDQTLTYWLGVKNNTAGDPAMVRTCCGCGSARLEINAGAAAWERATLTLGGVHVACVHGGSGSGQGSGSGAAAGGVFTEVLTDYCTGTLADGRRYLLFQGSSDNACSGDQDDCTNEFNVMIVCGEECVTPACGCPACESSPSPAAWYSFNLSGFESATYDGDWVWVQDPTDPCVWTASCLGATSVLDTFDDGGTPTWRLTHGSDVYTKAVADGDCTSLVLTFDSGGATHPATVTLTPFLPEGTAPQCCGGCEVTALRAAPLYITFPTCAQFYLSGQTVELTWSEADGMWLSPVYANGPYCDCEPGTYQFGISCDNGGFTWNNILCGPTAPGFDNILPTSCDPFYLEWTGDFKDCDDPEPFCNGTIILTAVAP